MNGFKGCQHKSFTSYEEAASYLREGLSRYRLLAGLSPSPGLTNGDNSSAASCAVTPAGAESSGYEASSLGADRLSTQQVQSSVAARIAAAAVTLGSSSVPESSGPLEAAATGMQDRGGDSSSEEGQQVRCYSHQLNCSKPLAGKKSYLPEAAQAASAF